MRFIFALMMVCALGACAAQSKPAPQEVSQLPPVTLTPVMSSGSSASHITAALSQPALNRSGFSGAPQAMAPSSDCAENVNNVVSHLEWLMAQNAGQAVPAP